MSEKQGIRDAWRAVRASGTADAAAYRQTGDALCNAYDAALARVAEIEAEANDLTTLDKKTLERLVDEQALRIAALEDIGVECVHPEERRHGLAVDSQAGELIDVDWCGVCGAFRDGGDSTNWLHPTAPAALQERIKALEGGIVAENRRVVLEHNALRERILELESIIDTQNDRWRDEP